MAGPVTDEDAEALFEYARRGKVLQVRELLERGVGPDRGVAYDGSTPLVIAARGGHGEVVRMLIERGAALDTRTDDGSALLMHAVSGGSVEAVYALLLVGANVNEVNDDGVTPLILASNSGYLEVARVLIEAGALVNTSAEHWGTALDGAEGSRHAEMAAYLVSVGGKPSSAMDTPKAERKIAASEQWGYDAFDGEKDY